MVGCTTREEHPALGARAPRPLGVLSDEVRVLPAANGGRALHVIDGPGRLDDTVDPVDIPAEMASCAFRLFLDDQGPSSRWWTGR